MPALTHIFEAESFAIDRALTFISSLPLKTIITIFCDNKAIVDCLNNVKLTKFSTLNLWYKLKSLRNSYIIYISWIKGHSNSIGNNLADSLAKKASNPPSALIFPISHYFISISSIKKSLKDAAISHANFSYCSSGHRKRLKLFTPSPFEINKFPWLHSAPKLVSWIITGHGPFNKHLFYLGLNDSPMCRFCELVDESIDHLIFLCPATLTFRRYFQELFNIIGYDANTCINYETIINSKLAWIQLTHFVNYLIS